MNRWTNTCNVQGEGDYSKRCNSATWKALKLYNARPNSRHSLRPYTFPLHSPSHVYPSALGWHHASSPSGGRPGVGHGELQAGCSWRHHSASVWQEASKPVFSLSCFGRVQNPSCSLKNSPWCYKPGTVHVVWAIPQQESATWHSTHQY